MKPESIAALNRLHEFCHGLVSAPPGVPNADIDAALAEMQALLNRVVQAESSTVDDSLMTREEVDLMKEGKVINAIKAVRNRTGLGLKESKDLVERAGSKLGLRKPSVDNFTGWSWTMPLK